MNEFFKHLYYFVTMESIEINLLCKHVKKVKSSLASISINSDTNWVKHSNVNEAIRNSKLPDSLKLI